MGKKILIIGGVAGGASVAARARRLDEFAEIIMFEKGPHVSFSNCSLPFYLSGMVKESEDLVLMDPETFLSQYNIQARVNHEVTKINRENKRVSVKNLLTGKEYEEDYDELVISTGANPIVPNIEGAQDSHVFIVRNVVDIEKLGQFLKNPGIRDVAVIGGGFIGVEVVGNLVKAGYNVTLVEAMDQIMAPFDYDMAQILHREMMDNGVNLILSDGVRRIGDDHIELSSGRRIQVQGVIMCIGVRPETTLAREAGLEIGETGGILVDHNYRTSDPNIHAVGDAVEVFNRLTHSKSRLALAGPAQRQARAAADDIYGICHRNTGVIGSSVVEIFELNAASTGLNEKMAQKEGYNYDFVYIIPGDKVGLMPNANPLYFKLIYEVPTGRVLGAQGIGKGNVDKRIDVIATLIMMDGTLEDLKELELCYAPLHGTAKDVVNHAALVALNILNGVYKQVPVTKVRELVEKNAYIIDVRERDEFQKGHLINAKNIPLSELRGRLDEVPTDQPVYLYCRTGQRSYNAIMALQHRGFDNVVNISGSFLGICNYEYFNDQVTGRDKILTQYNFD